MGIAFPNKGQQDGYSIYKEQNGTIVREPDNVTADTPVHVYFTGQIGSADESYCYGTTTSATINNVYATDPNFDGILIVVYGGGGGTDAYDRAAATDEIIKSIEEERGVEFNHITGTGSSSGDVYAAKFVAYEAMNGRDNLILGITGAGTFDRGTIPGAAKTKYSDLTHYDPNGAFFTDEEAAAIVASGTQVYMVERGDIDPNSETAYSEYAPENYTTTRQMNEQGINPIILHNYDGYNHNNLSNNPLNDGLFNFYDNDTDTVDSMVEKYNPVQYDHSLGTYKPVSSADIIAANSASSYFDYSKYLNNMPYEITPYEKESAYKELKNIGSIGVTYPNGADSTITPHDPYIVSDLDTVTDYMTKIREQISTSSATNSFGGYYFGGSGAGGMLGCIMGYIEAYYNAVGALLSSLTAETDSIISFAQAYADLDADYANKAGSIMSIDANGNISKVDLNEISIPKYPTGTSNSDTTSVAGTASGAAGAASAIAGAGAAEVGKEPKATHNQQTNATPSNTNDFSRRANSNISTERLPDGTYKTYVKHDDGTVSVTTYDRKGNELSEEVIPANGDTVMVDSTAKPEEELIVDNGTSSQAAAAAQSGSAARIIKDENSDSVNMDKGVYRPTYSGSGEPISYNKHTKSVDGNKVTHTYYDDEGNVVGETVTENGKVASSYYDYVDENGDTVRVNYGNVPAGAESHVSTVEDIKTEETVQESSQENRETPTGTPPVAGETYSDKVDAFRGTGKEESTSKTASQPATESATEPVTESVTEQRDESTDSFKRAGGGIMGNNGPFAGGTGWEEVRAEKEADVKENGISFKTPITGADYSIKYDKEDKTLTATRTNQDGSSHQKVTDFNDQTVTNTWVKSDGSSIEQVSDLSSGRLIEQTKYDAESGVTSARNPDGTKTVINPDGSSVTTGAFGKVIEETEGVTINNGEGFIGHSGKFKVDESKPIQTHDTGIDYGIHFFF